MNNYTYRDLLELLLPQEDAILDQPIIVEVPSFGKKVTVFRKVDKLLETGESDDWAGPVIVLETPPKKQPKEKEEK